MDRHTAPFVTGRRSKPKTRNMEKQWYFIEATYLSKSGKKMAYAGSVEAKDEVTAFEKAGLRIGALKDFKSRGTIKIRLQHPIDSVIRETTDELIDERIFSCNDMYDFAYRIAMEAMAAAFDGRKSVNGRGLENYILEQLDEIPGS